MPRDEATMIGVWVEETAKAFFAPTEIRVVTCGSYRRGKETCGDVDVLICRTDGSPIQGMLSPLLA
jgi:DNA polymerase lambda